MANPMFGWSVQDVIKLVQICDRFFEAYRDGPGGANADIINFKAQVENCQNILRLVQNELQDQGRNFLSSQLKYHSLEETLQNCERIFDTSEFLKAKGDQRALKRVYATMAYMWEVKEKIQHLSGILQRHMSYIQVFLQLSERANTKLQTKQLENYGRHLETQGRHLEIHTEYHQRHEQMLEEMQQNIQLLLDAQCEPRFINHHSRAQSVIETTAASSGTAVIAPAIYQQGQKALTEVQDLLEQTTLEFDNPQITDGQREVLRSIQQELETEEKRILNSIERNQTGAVQIAFLRRDVRVERQKLSRQDSAYASSIGSTEHQQPSSPIPWRYTESSGESHWGSVISLAATQAASIRQIPEQNDTSFSTQEVCSCAKMLCEIFPDYSGKINGRIEVPDAPKLLFSPDLPRPIPHIEPRGPNSNKQAYLVQIKGHAKIIPAVNSVEYIFESFEGSKKFQELVFNKELEPDMPINVRRIYSGRAGKRTKESDQVALRVWRIPNSSIATRNDLSLLFAVGEEGKPVKEHIEIFLHDIITLVNKSGKWLRANLKSEDGKCAGEMLNWLEFQLGRSPGEESKEDRATLAKYLDPSWIPTRV